LRIFVRLVLTVRVFSWGSGANPWGPEKEDQFSKPNHWDGMLEVVGVTGVVHLGQIQSGFRSALRIAQVIFIKTVCAASANALVAGWTHQNSFAFGHSCPSGWRAVDTKSWRRGRAEISTQGRFPSPLQISSVLYILCDNF
jgi:Diacylglycerol kinase accessory domain